ncbi:hypothetical protein GGS23DRAFT_596742 [Durotheca rogersii]|uniref:uncharacterized protein n=1 Tax=Durotheca rogersii TaxID=419775 RepID=UPI00221ECE50|nr:uncharacterized protein GGS23DRAFT_596742 [Durotheca rogersii]KAI5863569.1 hypothetical protein GGS23DRAFT_596742 [Durotheca rogersii]
MTSFNTFRRFNELPKELRLLIWEYHFECAHLIVVHPALDSQNRDPKKEFLRFECTVLDSATNLIIQDGRPPSPLVNHEAHTVALSCHREWTRVGFGKDLSVAVASGRSRPRPLDPRMLVASVSAFDRRSVPRAQPVYVDWSRDMIYLCVAQAEQAFWSLRLVPWRDRVRKLAVLIPQSEFDRAIPFGPTDPIRDILESTTELEELLVVLIPQADIAAAAASAHPASALSRGAFGFVPYVAYLKETGLAKDHVMYARTAMSFKDALAGLPKKIKLERVVDLDYQPSNFGYYQRRILLESGRS